MNAQQVFYILGSVAIVVFLLFMLAFALFLYSLQRKINRMHRMATFLGSEMSALIRDGRSYSRYLGASLGSSILGKILRILR